MKEPREAKEEEGHERGQEQVREHYREVALDVQGGGDGCCDSGCCNGLKDQVWGAELYAAAERAELPDAAVLASLGCGNPIAIAELREGETVLDLGSGGGIDVILSARRVGPIGRAYGLDMTDEMLELARRNAAEAGVGNVEFLKGYIEDVPLPRGSVDVIISNCVINLSADKTKVFEEMRRVLRPGGRVGISDVVASDDLSPADRAGTGQPRRVHRRCALVRRVPLGDGGCRVRGRRDRADARRRRWDALGDHPRASVRMEGGEGGGDRSPVGSADSALLLGTGRARKVREQVARDRDEGSDQLSRQERGNGRRSDPGERVRERSGERDRRVREAGRRREDHGSSHEGGDRQGRLGHAASPTDGPDDEDQTERATASESHRGPAGAVFHGHGHGGGSNIRLATMTPSPAPTIWATTKAAAVGPAISRRNRPAIVTSGFR